MSNAATGWNERSSIHSAKFAANSAVAQNSRLVQKVRFTLAKSKVIPEAVLLGGQ
jgi:hypothetical protein